ncbi:AMMECR1 domain-containing protein [candidate division KSB3 bacterium]|uniref:AMMECR1 domain-containing protein n=1 Tax=candidate division KSB3 bacterium TaxID=2044937 RepID=A0A2G6E3B5_9BACT|nr:MAG: AMMECR1 domain-containing protein [candidate division KSB3 bacterium]PIE29109.1 MAG: AMMECR1 domain-containing protein [candidate division KSB3 bacterium]
MNEMSALNSELQHSLLEIAREAIESYTRTRKERRFVRDSPALHQKRGVFVTIKTHGRLRGCIGHIEGSNALYQTVADMAVAASSRDPRFPPVREDELDALQLEISVMSPLRKVDSPDEVRPGVHGIFMSRGPRSGLLLPQVATEHGWDRVTFLEQTCVKAGLPPNAWQDPDTDIYVFSAQVFGESV